MKTFEEYLTELTTRRRHTMPQLTDFEGFKKDLQSSGIKMTLDSVKPHTLDPTQSNFNQDKVDRMKSEGGWDNKPIISSRDGYVIDGHHRWLAAKQLKQRIKTQVIDMDAEDLLDFCKDKDYVEKKGINESIEELS